MLTKPKKPKALWFRQRNPEASPKTRKAIRRVSKKKAKSDRIYNNRVKEWLRKRDNYWCRVFPSMKATQVHHSFGRLGSLLMDERYWVPVSSEGHFWLHNNVEQARSLGFLAQRGDWNKQ